MLATGVDCGLGIAGMWVLVFRWPFLVPLGPELYSIRSFSEGVYSGIVDMRTSELKYGDEAAKSSDIICMKKCTYI